MNRVDFYEATAVSSSNWRKKKFVFEKDPAEEEKRETRVMLINIKKYEYCRRTIRCFIIIVYDIVRWLRPT